jgi:hypothetical protein
MLTVSHARPIAGGELFELAQIRPAPQDVVVEALEMGLVPKAGAFEFGRPKGSAVAKAADHLDKVFQCWRARGGLAFRSAATRSAASAISSRTRCAEPGPTPGHQLQHPEP